MPNKILVLEDNAIATMDIRLQFEQMGLRDIVTASSYLEATKAFEKHRFDLLLLDIDLGTSSIEDGIDFAKSVRKKGSDVPIVFLTAYDDSETIGRASLTDPSGYLPKPFSFQALRAAVKLALARYDRRSVQTDTFLWLTENIGYDSLTHHLHLGEERTIHLTPKEDRLVTYFLRHPHRIVSSSILSDYVWMGEPPPSENALRNLIYRINKKVSFRLFDYVPAEGYRLCVEKPV